MDDRRERRDHRTSASSRASRGRARRTRRSSPSAAVPLLITLSVSAAEESWAILVAAVASLTLTSLVAARAGDLSVSRTLVRTLAVGVGTLAVSYLIGRVLF
ncbi:MAG TPA: hypothetical protein VJM07_05360 [Gaiella sp.]|nr:hypothetical protein [Gaiella sp.]